jgi:hypothetical protein
MDVHILQNLLKCEICFNFQNVAMRPRVQNERYELKIISGIEILTRIFNFMHKISLIN